MYFPEVLFQSQLKIHFLDDTEYKLIKLFAIDNNEIYNVS